MISYSLSWIVKSVVQHPTYPLVDAMLYLCHHYLVNLVHCCFSHCFMSSMLMRPIAVKSHFYVHIFYFLFDNFHLIGLLLSSQESVIRALILGVSF